MKKIALHLISLVSIILFCFIDSSDAGNAFKGELKESLSILGLSLGESTLDNVEKVFGPSKLIETGEAALYEAKKCYVLGKGKDAVSISFIVGEMGGGTLSAIRLYPVKDISLFEIDDCARTHVSNAEIFFENGLKLGLTKDQVKKILGLPQKEEKYAFEYHYDLKITIPKSHDRYDEFIKCCAGVRPFSGEQWWIYADFNLSSLNGLSISHIATLCE